MPETVRLRSIDVLRGLDVLLMLFVNEMAGVPGTPAFLLHKHAADDGMTVTDVVFPAFLFMTGLALPFAVGRRLGAGASRAAVWRHVAVRSVSLLLLGVLMINAEHAAEGALLSPAVWNILATAAAVVAWSAPAPGDRRRTALRLAATVALVALAFVYRGEGLSGAFQIRPYWWHILGLIGWAYLVAGTLYLCAGDRSAVLLALVALLYGLFVADVVGGAAWLAALQPHVAVGPVLGSHAAIVLSGALLAVLFRRHEERGRPRVAFAWTALGFAVGLALAGAGLHALHTLHPAFRVSKIAATPPWCLFSSAATCAAWVVVFVLADVEEWHRWLPAVTLAGRHALLVYLMAPFALSVLAVIGMPELVGTSTWLGALRAVVFAWIVVRASGWLGTHGLRMQL